MTMTRYTEATESYNERRYGRPWMAIVSASLTSDFSFIDWNGRPGRAGEFSFQAPAGTILAHGQKDIRKGRGGVDGYRICMPDGTLPALSDKSVLALLKLPFADRAVAAARLLIAGAEAVIAGIPAEKLADAYYAAKANGARAEIARFQAFLPSAAPVPDAEDYLGGAA